MVQSRVQSPGFTGSPLNSVLWSLITRNITCNLKIFIQEKMATVCAFVPHKKASYVDRLKGFGVFYSVSVS